MPLSNRAPVNAAGQIMVTGTTPTPAWPVLGGMTYDPVTGELAVTSAVPNATDPWVGGLRFTNLGSLYIVTTIPSPVFYVGGLPVSTLGQLFMSANPPVGSVGGWPIAGDGGVAGIGSGIGPVPIFWAPLLTTLVPTVAGNPAFTFTRATTAYATGVGPTGNAVDGQVLILCDAGEPRFHGARRISANNWSATYADGSAIPAATLLGYVAENAATNLCLQSQTFDNAAWVKTNGTATANTQAGPDGTLTADTFAATGVNGTCSQPVTATAVPYTFSVYLKRLAGTSQVALSVDGITFVDVTAQVNSATWSRVAVTLTPAAGTINPTIRLAVSGDSMYLWGAQVEQSSDPTSYIPTVAVSVTRNRDVLTYPSASNIVASGAAETWYAEARAVRVTVGNTLVGVNANYRALLLGFGGVVRPYSYHDAAASGPALGVVQAAPDVKAAVAYGSGSATVANNGAVGTPVVMGAQAAGENVIQIASDSGLTYFVTIRNVKFFNVRLADADLITLTA